MVSPPFSLNVNAPANSDVAANFPALDRSDKNVIQSWLTTQWNSQGHTTADYYDAIGSTYGLVSAPTCNAGTGVIYRDTDTNFKFYDGDQARVMYLQVPPGTIIMSGSSTIPNGYLFCNGTNVSRTAYANLFAAIGTAFGAGDGSTTFTLPNFSGAFPLGSARTSPGGTGGSPTQSLSANNLPSFTIGSVGVAVTVSTTGSTSGSLSVSTSGGSHSHNFVNGGGNVYLLTGSGGYGFGSGGSGQAGVSSTTSSGSLSMSGSTSGSLSVSTSGSGTGITGSIGYSGSASAFSILPPYVGVVFYIKY